MIFRTINPNELQNGTERKKGKKNSNGSSLESWVLSVSNYENTV